MELSWIGFILQRSISVIHEWRSRVWVDGLADSRPPESVLHDPVDADDGVASYVPVPFRRWVRKMPSELRSSGRAAMKRSTWRSSEGGTGASRIRFRLPRTRKWACRPDLTTSPALSLVSSWTRRPQSAEIRMISLPRSWIITASSRSISSRLRTPRIGFSCRGSWGLAATVSPSRAAQLSMIRSGRMKEWKSWAVIGFVASASRGAARAATSQPLVTPRPSLGGCPVCGGPPAPSRPLLSEVKSGTVAGYQSTADRAS
jgi:hypothetical protein